VPVRSGGLAVHLKRALQLKSNYRLVPLHFLICSHLSLSVPHFKFFLPPDCPRPLPHLFFFAPLFCMSKRSHTQLHTPIDADGQPLQKTRSSGVRRQSVTDDIGEFEDPWEDEIEEEELAQNPTNDPDGLSAQLPDAWERLIVISQSPFRHGSR